MKAVKDFDVSEVCIFITSMGLAAKMDAFRSNSIDGDMLVALTAEDLQNDLGLTSLQTKKVLKQVASLQGEGGGDAGGGGGGGGAERLEALQQELQVLESENAALKAQLQEFQPPPPPPRAAPAPAPAPVPAPPPPPQQRSRILGQRRRRLLR